MLHPLAPHKWENFQPLVLEMNLSFLLIQLFTILNTQIKIFPISYWIHVIMWYKKEPFSLGASMDEEHWDSHSSPSSLAQSSKKPRRLQLDHFLTK